ncbi:MAG: methyltransferase [Candidatus Hermodarchaeota archaeon]|nr:methyltransferase [Candidatus Hermodarchaeota archaeon]
MSPSAAFYEDVWVVVDDGVYEPSDDTFMLCANLGIALGDTMLEVGTGCGLVAIVAAKAGAQVVATDQSDLAVQNAKKNVALHNLDSLVEIRQGNLFDPIHSDEKFSLLTFNPPYLPGTKADTAFDPAWSGGEKGYEITEKFIAQCSRYLHADGRLLLIQSSLSEPEHIRTQLKQQFHSVQVKEEKAFFFERLLLFLARKPIQQP